MATDPQADQDKHAQKSRAKSWQVGMTPSQIKATLAMLRKTLPDLKPIKVETVGVGAIQNGFARGITTTAQAK